MLAILENNLLAGAKIPTEPLKNRMVPLPPDEADIKYRKIDKGSQLLISTVHTADIFVTGKDKLLKKYEFPTDSLSQVDFKRAP